MWMGYLLKKTVRLILLLLETLLDAALMLSLCLALMGVCTAMMESCTGEPCFFLGYKIVHISSSSMEEAIGKGDIVLIREADKDEVSPGDVLFFRKNGGYVVHRFVGIDEERRAAGADGYMITKGDNNNIADVERLDPEDILGKVVMNIGI